eukprot:g5455.t1
MWKFVSSGSSGDNPMLETLNQFIGRQYWEFDPDSGTAEDHAEIERLRSEFTKHRFEKHDADDALLRYQARDRLKSVDIYLPMDDDLPSEGPIPDDRLEASLDAGIKFYECLQEADGHWPGDYGGPMFLLPGLVITAYVTGSLDRLFPSESKIEICRYLRNHQNLDGGFGLHIEGHSSMFGTSLNYVLLRLMGLDRDDPVVRSARDWIQSHRGAIYATSWAKFWLAVLGVYKWEGINPLPPETWLLPYSKLSGLGIIHPGRMWCHCRMVYLPMSYVYGVRHKLEVAPTWLVSELREELYVESFDEIDWNSCRNKVSKEDSYYPHPFIQDVLWWIFYQLEPWLKWSSIRKRAVKECIEHIHYEDENTRYIDIGPVNKSINMLACWLEDPESIAFKKHLCRVPDYLWLAEDGMKMQGYNGSQLWDLSFAVQAIFATKLQHSFKNCLKKAHDYLRATQIQIEATEPLEKYYRHISKGAWPFSTQDHGWPISDCTSEALKAVLLLRGMSPDDVGPPISDQRLFEAVNVILSYQNNNGGTATYEKTRSYPFIEVFNPSETFGDIIIDYSYVECTSACVQALTAFAKEFPSHRTDEIAKSLSRAREFLVKIQREDGSWYGSWGVCFTYGTWFGIAGLSALGEFYHNSNPVRLACNFLLEHQRSDGGWGESYLSCQEKVYSELEGTSHVVNTAWAIMALIQGQYHLANTTQLHKAARFLMKMQQAEGDWPQQHISGVFNRNCAISYTNYRYIFPLWALAMYRDCVHELEKA